MEASRISRGILIGGALGAFSVIFGFSQSMFFAVGFGMIAGFFAGLTIQKIEEKKKKEK